MMRLNEFKALNKAMGYYWFSPDTMRFFKTRISNWDAISGLFITSEQPPHGPRVYSVRKADFITGRVVSIGQFRAYKSLKTAKTGLKRARSL